MERLNVNVPVEAREALRELARQAQCHEAELARDLLVAAIQSEERAALSRTLSGARSPALRKRLRQMTTGMEKLRGRAR